MRQFTEEEYNEIEHFASLLYSDEELSRILEVPAEDLRLEMMLRKGELYRRITRGRFITESAHREAAIKMSQRGSTPAHTQVEELIRKMKGGGA